MNKTLSVIILSKNEQSRIGHTIQSVQFADEILVVDNGSTDQTRTIAKKMGAKVIIDETNSFSDLRNIGMNNALGSWILYVDADETIPSPLAKEIQGIVKNINPEITCYFVRRNNSYLGHPWPVQDRMQRLFLRKAIRAWTGDLHETADVEGQNGELHYALDHNTHRTLEEMLDKTNVWSETEVKLRYEAGHPPIVWWRFFRVMATAFWQSYVIEQGYKAGTVGVIESLYQAFSLFITYAKLWELQQKNN